MGYTSSCRRSSVMQLSIWWAQSGAVISIGGINPFTLNWGQVRDIVSFLPLYWSVTSLCRVGEGTTFNSSPHVNRVELWLYLIMRPSPCWVDLFPTACLIGIQSHCWHNFSLLCRYGLVFLPVVHKLDTLPKCLMWAAVCDACKWR